MSSGITDLKLVSEMPGKPVGMVEHKGDVFVATDRGVFRLIKLPTDEWALEEIITPVEPHHRVWSKDGLRLYVVGVDESIDVWVLTKPYDMATRAYAGKC